MPQATADSSALATRAERASRLSLATPRALPGGVGPQRLMVTQVAIGRYHHFHLARQLERARRLERLWTGYPRFKLADESGVSPARISTFPWFQTLNMAWPRVSLFGRSRAARREISWLAHETLDRRVALSLARPGALIALSGQGRTSGRRMQQLGGWHICDRGSTHIRVQDRLMREEHEIWGLDYVPIDPRMVAKEEAEYEFADLISVPSRFVERSFLQVGTPVDKLIRIPYGARLDRFRPSGAPAPGCLDFLFVGHVGLRKGTPYLLQAFARLRHPRKRLRIVGSIDPDFMPLLSRLPLDHVELLGPVPNVELVRLYSRSHALVLPSIEEGLAMVMAEAMACGCPVIATGNTGADDLFASGVEGFVVPIRSVDAVLRALEQVADDPAGSAAMRRACRERVDDLAGWDTFGDAWLAVLEGLEAASCEARP